MIVNAMKQVSTSIAVFSLANKNLLSPSHCEVAWLFLTDRFGKPSYPNFLQLTIGYVVPPTTTERINPLGEHELEMGSAIYNNE